MRTKGTGSIKLKGEGRWLVRWTDTNEGARRAKLVKGNKKAAEDYLAGVRVSKKRAEYAPPTQQTFSDYLVGWVAERRTLGNVCERTLIDNARAIERYVVPSNLGRKRLEDLQPKDFSALYTDLRGERKDASGKVTQRGPRTVQYLHGVLRCALNDAVRANVLAANVTARVQIPKQTKTDRPAMSFENVKSFREAAQHSGHAVFFDFLLFTGARPGEGLALKWTDVDLDAGVARIERALSRPGGKFEIREPKTKQSKRTVGLNPELCSALRSHKAEQSERMMRHRDVWSDQGFVFPGPFGEPGNHEQINRRAFKTVVKRAKLDPKLTLYCLRHTFATLALANGSSIHEVADAMGHTSPALVLSTYGKALPEKRAAVFANLGARICG